MVAAQAGRGSAVGSESAPPILHWDHDVRRRREVAAVVRRCGGVPVGLATALLPGAGVEREAAVVVTALTGPEPPESVLALVREARERELPVVAYEDGADGWSLPTKCRSLLAGARLLLDSARPGFKRELETRLRPLVTAARRAMREDAAAQAIMESLGLVGESLAMRRVFRWILRASPLSDLPVLITGETGCGKELAARAVHRLDPKRGHGPFVPVNCGSISPHLAESELFGHRRGAFTGAAESRKGLIRAAHGGVLFLDEIGELDSNLQTKLLRVLQDNRVLAVGEDRETEVSVRVVAATHRDLRQLVAKGEFREDLFHRLNVLSVHIPPLRERPDDVAPLVRHLLRRNEPVFARSVPGVGDELLTALSAIRLPGNVRELENLVRGMLLAKADEGPLDLADLPPPVWSEIVECRPEPGTARTGSEAGPPPEVDRGAAREFLALAAARDWKLVGCLEECERRLIEGALRMTGGNQSATARLLGVSPRTVYNKMRKHRLRPH